MIHNFTTPNLSSNWKTVAGKPCVLDEENGSMNATSTALLVSLSSCLLSISLVGNVFLCFLLARFKHLRTVNNILVADLTVVNLLNTVVNGTLFLCSVVLGLESFRGRLRAWLTCTVHLYFSLLVITTFFLMMMHRFLAIRFPFKHSSLQNKTSIFVAILIKWLLSLVPVFAVFAPLYKLDLGRCLASSYRMAYTKENAFQVGRFFVGPPFLLGNVCLYVLSRYLLMVNIKSLPLGPSSLRTTTEKTRKALNTVLITLLVYCLCYILCFLLVDTFELFKTSRWQVFSLYSLLFIPSAAHPLIYFIRVRCFRMVMQQWQIFRCCQTRVNIEVHLVIQFDKNPRVRGRTRCLENGQFVWGNQEQGGNGEDIAARRHLSAEQQDLTNFGQARWKSTGLIRPLSFQEHKQSHFVNAKAIASIG